MSFISGLSCLWTRLGIKDNDGQVRRAFYLAGLHGSVCIQRTGKIQAFLAIFLAIQYI